MSRYDKYDGKAGGFRAPLASAVDGVTVKTYTAYAVSLDANGRLVIGTAGQSGLCGVAIFHGKKQAGEVVDVMTHGEIAEAATADGTAIPAGTIVNVEADGDVVTSAGTKIGHTVQAGRLVVRL